MVMVVIMSTTLRPPSCPTLVCAAEDKDICSTRGKSSERARMERVRKGEERSVEEKVRRRRKIARRSPGLENLPLHLPRRG